MVVASHRHYEAVQGLDLEGLEAETKGPEVDLTNEEENRVKNLKEGENDPLVQNPARSQFLDLTLDPVRSQIKN